LQLPLGLVYEAFFSPRALFVFWPLWLGSISGRLPFYSSPLPPVGRVLYVDLLAPYVLLDYLLIVDDVLADPYLLLDLRALLDHVLFLYDRHKDLVLTDVGL